MSLPGLHQKEGEIRRKGNKALISKASRLNLPPPPSQGNQCSTEGWEGLDHHVYMKAWAGRPSDSENARNTVPHSRVSVGAVPEDPNQSLVEELYIEYTSILSAPLFHPSHCSSPPKSTVMQKPNTYIEVLWSFISRNMRSALTEPGAVTYLPAMHPFSVLGEQP